MPDDFDPPRELQVPEFHLVPLGPRHNESDHAAWTSWVRADVAELDGPLHAAVSRWLVERWPFDRVTYADRPPA